MVRWEYTPKGPTGKPLKDERGRRLRVVGSESCGPSKRYAKKREKQILEDIYAGRPIRPVVQFITVGAFRKEYLSNSKTTKAANTYANFEKPAVDSFADWFGENKPLGNVDVQALFDWRDHLLKKGYKSNTVRMRLRDFSVALNYAKERNFISENPFNQVKRRSLFPEEEETERYITQDEMKKLIPRLPIHVARAFYFILKTGLRHGELLNLDWKVIERPKAGPWIMTITRASARGIRSGHKTKTRNTREVEIDPAAAAVLGEPKSEGKVFGWSTRDVIESALRAAARDLELGTIRPHDGRHTWATNFMYRTGNIFELMYRGGWKSTTSAARYQSIRKRDEPIEILPFPHYFHTIAA